MRSLRRIVLAAAGFAALLAAPGAEAQRDLRIRDFDARLRVHEDGSLEVTETLVVAFRGSWNGILRDIRLDHRTAEGWRRKLTLSDVRVTDAAGTPLETFEESGSDSWTRRLRIRVPGASDAERTVVVHYRVHDVIRFFHGDEPSDNFDELYWNVTGSGWEIPIDRVTARLTLPGAAAPTRTAVYTGPAGSIESEAKVAEADGGVVFVTTRGLHAYEGMTVGVGWAPGAIATRPTAEDRRRAAAARQWPLALPILAFLLGFARWKRHGRDPADQAVVVQFEPPDGLTPAELGTLIDNSAGIRDIISTLVDLAVRGHIGIEEEVRSRALGLIRTREYAFHLRHHGTERALAPHEELFLAGLRAHSSPSGRSWSEVRASIAAASGGGGASHPPDHPDDARATRVVRLNDLREKFYTSLPGIRNAVYDGLVERGYYLRRPDHAPGPWVLLAVLSMVAGIGGAIAASEGVLPASPWAVAGAGVASAAIFAFFASIMGARTEKGARTREAAMGFREFLQRVESERYRRMITGPELFERYLPHAMAFGVAERWARAFEGMYREAPQWYAGGSADGFRVNGFTSDMVRMSSAAQGSMSSSPSSSGSGGGGSSGGGSGGGGGGGW
jgi:hypothetical protein